MLGLRSVRRRKPRRADVRLRAEQPAVPKVRSWRAWLVRLPALLLIAGSLYILHELFRAERFLVKQVAVAGTRLLDQQQVVGALGLEQASVFWVNPTHLVEHLRASFPIVAAASVKCTLPDQVSVTVEERSDLLLWESGGQTWWVDADGNVLGQVEDALSLVVVHDVEGVAPAPTGRITGVPWGLVRDLVRAMPTLRSLDYARDRGLVVYATAREWPVYLGHEGDGSEKVAILLALTQQLEASGNVAYIDLRNERRPVYQRQ